MWPAGITAVSQSSLTNDAGGFGNTKTSTLLDFLKRVIKCIALIEARSVVGATPQKV